MIGVTDVWLVVGQFPIKAGWWNAFFPLLDLAERILTIFTLSNLATPYHKDFLLPAPPWSFQSFEWLQISPHINPQLRIPFTQTYHTSTLIVRQLPIKVGWRDACLALLGFSRSSLYTLLYVTVNCFFFYPFVYL